MTTKPIGPNDNIILKGNKKVIVASIKFTNDQDHDFTIQQLKYASGAMTKFYNTNSRNQLNVYTECHLIDVPFEGSETAVTSKAGPYVKQKFPGRDIYIIISKYVNNHSGKGFAYVKNTLIRTIKHECGHCFRLAHAGAFVYNGKGYTYDQYGDGLSPMGGQGDSSCLTAPAYDFLSFTPESEKVVVSDLTQLPATFKLKRINDFKTKALSMLIFKAGILKNKDKDAYLSFPQQTRFFKDQPFAALHLRNLNADGYGGGSAKIKTFAKAFYDQIFTGLNIIIDPVSTTDQLVITVSMTPPNISHKVEVVPLADTE
jgi:hypothetical protein